MAGVYLDMSCEDESGEKCGQEIQKRRFPTYPGEASPSMEGPHLSGKMVEVDSSGVRKRNWTAGINPAGYEAGSVAMASKTSLNTPISFGSVSLSGRAREMEDAISVRPGFVQFQGACSPFHFFAVFDGHGGSHVSALCKEMMHSVLAEEIMAEPARGVSSGAEETRWKSAVERCFRRMDRLALSACACGRVGEPTCTCERSGIESDIVGSTAVIAVVGGGRLLVANCGDSRAVLSRGGRTVPLSVDHKPDRPDELARIEAAGGRVIYVNGARVHGILAMSRALGDKYLKPVVISAPEIVISEITAEDECLIIASDGLWDVIPNELACSIAMRCLADRTSNCGGSGGRQMEEHLWAPKSWCSTAAVLLARLALGRKSADNISVIVVDLRTEFPP